ncbi:TetR/AcrR family transcriptional regulator [Oceanospirillum sanctuarii]|uniref:TetR/AcrR family transcriptional regulator n=1 Tax=Oceanospirillum sanctuarii TaxID=1434821 RepID=UPI000A3BA271|nr:TetR/AcrR family transcriptional regulator [Oceanospirillum sanctuarii]
MTKENLSKEKVTKKPKQGRGRPSQPSEARQRLLDAGLELFTEQGYKPVSTRMIAREAGVDAAMIRYYFGSKVGLFETIIRETFTPIIDQFRFSELPDGETPQLSGEELMQKLMTTYYQVMSRRPGLPRLVFQILHQQDSEAYPVFFKTTQELVHYSRKWITDVLEASDMLREDVDPARAQFSFISLMIFPLIAPPVISQQLGISHSPETISEHIKHTSKLLTQGMLKPTGRKE